jgi:hypothetical protein
MIPKAGDVVDINPLFKMAHKAHYKFIFHCDPPENWGYGEKEDGHIHIIDVENYRGAYIVHLGPGSSYCIDLDGHYPGFKELVSFGWSHDVQLFVPIDVGRENPIIDLKSLNTQPGSTNCAGCNGLLKDPGMGPRFKYCPKCEP